MEASQPGRLALTSFQVWPVLAYGAAILVLGSLPMAPPGAARVSDKMLHFFAFGLLAPLACRAFAHRHPGASRRVTLARGFAAAVLLGGALELWQALLPYRTCELLDWVADSAGAALGAGAIALVGWLSKRRPAAR